MYITFIRTNPTEQSEFLKTENQINGYKIVSSVVICDESVFFCSERKYDQDHTIEICCHQQVCISTLNSSHSINEMIQPSILYRVRVRCHRIDVCHTLQSSSDGTF